MPARLPLRPLTDEQRDLAATCARQAFRIGLAASRRYPLAADEVRGAAVLSLIDAARAFDPGRKLKLTTLVGKSANRAVWRAVKTARRGKRDPARLRPLGRQDPPARDEDPGPPLPPGAADRVLSRLDPRSESVVRAVVFGGLGMREAGQPLGITRQRAYQIYQEALARLAEDPEAQALWDECRP